MTNCNENTDQIMVDIPKYILIKMYTIGDMQLKKYAETVYPLLKTPNLEEFLRRTATSEEIWNSFTTINKIKYIANYMNKIHSSENNRYYNLIYYKDKWEVSSNLIYPLIKDFKFNTVESAKLAANILNECNCGPF